jgi:hypothetical protein
MRGTFNKIGHEFVNAFLDNKVGRALNPMPIRSGGPENPLNLFNKDQLLKLANMSPAQMLGGAQSYFRGRTLRHGSEGLGFAGSINRGKAKVRRVAAGVGGGLLAANLLDIDPFGATGAANTLARLGAHGAAGLGITKMNMPHARLAGTAYMGFTAVNTLRGGNNLGPM